MLRRPRISLAFYDGLETIIARLVSTNNLRADLPVIYAMYDAFCGQFEAYSERDNLMGLKELIEGDSPETDWDILAICHDHLIDLDTPYRDDDWDTTRSFDRTAIAFGDYMQRVREREQAVPYLEAAE